MDNPEIICFNDVKEAFLNTQSAEELHLLTPRDIRNTIDSWATASTDKERVQELILEWLEDKYPSKEEKLSPADKHSLLQLTVSKAKRRLDSILSNEDHGKCNMEEYKENMDWLLNMVIPTDQNNETRFINLLNKMGYGYSDDINGYPYLFSFLSELIWYEFIICREVVPYKEELKSFKRYKHNPEDKVWIARLNYYKDIGVRNKHRHSATLNSNKWAISFSDFTKLYRKILGLQKRALLNPLK